MLIKILMVLWGVHDAILCCHWAGKTTPAVGYMCPLQSQEAMHILSRVYKVVVE